MTAQPSRVWKHVTPRPAPQLDVDRQWSSFTTDSFGLTPQTDRRAFVSGFQRGNGMKFRTHARSVGWEAGQQVGTEWRRGGLRLPSYSTLAPPVYF